MGKSVQAFEQKAREFVSLTLAVCKQELAAGRSPHAAEKSSGRCCVIGTGVGKNIFGSICYP